MSDQHRRDEVGRFLKSRRARLQPADVGLPATKRRRVRGLRREEVAALADIGVSWYTALENGDASGVSAKTLSDIADALRLNESERHYLQNIAVDPTLRASPSVPSRLEIDALMSIAYPAYIITADWIVIAYNDAFRIVWGIDDEPPIDFVSRVFFHERSRAMHGEHFAANIAPIVAMVRSGIGRHAHLRHLHAIRDRMIADREVEAIWNEFEVSSPLAPTSATIESAIGSYSYETLTLPIGDAYYGIVVEVPDLESRKRIANASSGVIGGSSPHI